VRFVSGIVQKNKLIYKEEVNFPAVRIQEQSEDNQLAEVVT
jgi:hypothetical protein